MTRQLTLLKNRKLVNLCYKTRTRPKVSNTKLKSSAKCRDKNWKVKNTRLESKKYKKKKNPHTHRKTNGQFS